ncbi:MAG: BlaI/MecI/CopY family transcriptional regulator [Planctomycetes bacterium]|nr:BlaI/MecI/CopY family transcriptional regulator [Planctomycetota bacterium]
MARKKLPRPTDAELAILRILWERGPSTVREVHEAQNDRSKRTGHADQTERSKETGYTSALKLLQIMLEKGLVDRDESERSHVYRARASEDATQRQLVGDLLDRAFGGSARTLILQALSAKKATPEELAEIRRLLARFEEGTR